MNSFEAAAASARPGCPKCHGKGSYMYDHNHGTICDLCCLHQGLRWKLSHHYAGWPGMCCAAGCGHVERSPLEELVRFALNHGVQRLIWRWRMRRFR